jgi:hypothetical protein
MRQLMTNKNIYLELIFDHIIGKNSSPRTLQIFLCFTNFQDFQLKLRDLYLPKGTILMAEFFTTNTTFQALKDRIPFGRFVETCVFLGETPWNRPTGIITFFAINQEGVDQSFSFSNSTEISMRRFYAQNFITIGSAFEALSCKRTAGRPDTLTDSIVFSLFEYTKRGEYQTLTLSSTLHKPFERFLAMS